MNMKKRIAALLTGIGMVFGLLVGATLPASAANLGNCNEWRQSGGYECNQQIQVNNAQVGYVAVKRASQDDFYRLTKGSTSYFICGETSGLRSVYTHAGYNVRIKGYFGTGSDNGYKTIYFTTTGWHTLPRNFISPYCNDSNVSVPKHGFIDDIYEYKE